MWYNWECKDDGVGYTWRQVVAGKRVSELDRKLKYIFDVAEFEKDARPVKWSLMNSHHYIITPDTVLNVSAPTAESEHLVLGSIQAY